MNVYLGCILRLMSALFQIVKRKERAVLSSLYTVCSCLQGRAEGTNRGSSCAFICTMNDSQDIKYYIIATIDPVNQPNHHKQPIMILQEPR